MNLFKKLVIFLCILHLSTSLTVNCLCNDDLDGTDLLEAQEQEIIKMKQSGQLNCTSIQALNILLAVNIPKILASNFYLKTYPLTKRPVNTLPVFTLFHTKDICENLQLKFGLFFNETPRKFFTKDSSAISSYIGIQSEDILNALEEAEAINDQAADILALFRNAAIQERRLGLMFQALKNIDNLSLEFTLPFFYQEKNYFLTEQERIEIQNSLPSGNSGNSEADLRQFLVADKIGFGDLKFRAGLLALESERMCAKIGLHATIPTAFALKQGIIGSHFRKKCVRPIVDLKNIACLIKKFQDDDDQEAKDELITIAKDFGFDTINWLSSIVLDTPLGNNGHFGIGFFIEPKFKINECVIIHAQTSLEYLFPSTERRAFLTTKNPQDFIVTDFDKENEDAATNTLIFLSRQTTETFFPEFFPTNVEPGLMFQLTIAPILTLREWNFEFGYDFWLQEKPKLNINKPCNLSLQVNEGIQPFITQNKLFARVYYNKINPCNDWSLSLRYDETFTSSGIGKDFTISGNFDINF